LDFYFYRAFSVNPGNASVYLLAIFAQIKKSPTPPTKKAAEIGGALPHNSCCSPESMSTDKSNIDIPSGKNFPCVE